MAVKVNSFKFSTANLHSNEFPAATYHFLRACSLILPSLMMVVVINDNMMMMVVMIIMVVMTKMIMMVVIVVVINDDGEMVMIMVVVMILMAMMPIVAVIMTVGGDDFDVDGDDMMKYLESKRGYPHKNEPVRHGNSSTP
jgi:hypothetical protein